ncbi:MAG: hypothetical protein AAGK78_16170, partial [Planctomycetota bacterium]
MQKDLVIVVTDGSLESAAICPIARSKGEVVVLDISGGGGEGDPRRQAVQAQIDYLRPRETQSIAPAETDTGVAGQLLSLTAAIGHAAVLAQKHVASAIYIPLRIGEEIPESEQAHEWLQLTEELLRYGLSLANIKIEAPLLDMEPRQVVD